MPATLSQPTDWLGYAATPEVAAHIKQNRDNGYYGQDWTDEAIAQNYWRNVGSTQGTAADPNLDDAGFLQSVASQGSDPADTPAVFNRLTALADAGNQQAIQILGAAGYENTEATSNLPIEQGVLQTALPGLLADLGGDPARALLASQLGGNATGAYNTAVQALSPEANAARLLAEQQQADATGAAVAGSAATSAAAQLQALQDSIAAMQSNLTGDLAARAAALQAQIASLNSNLDTLDASQKATLATQIAANQKNLEDSINAQRTSLTTEMASLRGAADANSVARQSALQKELDGLTAAQAPMSQARLDSANALATSINLGLQGTEDALTASRAKQGYLGTSSFDQGNLARAGITARQGAAQALGSARELNANDLRTIQTHGATEGRSIADQLAANYLNIGGSEATGVKSLADLLATGTRSIGDTGAAGNATISGQTATGKFNVGNAGAGQTFQDQVFGADQQRAMADALAKGSGSIGTTLAQQQQAAADAATMAKQGYFDNAYTRGLAGTLSIPGLSSSLAGNLTAIDNYGTSGLNRTLGSLNWWAAPNTAAPVAGQVAVQADNSGNQIAALGSGLLGSAIGVGDANNWWASPKTSGTNPNNWNNFDTIDFAGGNIGTNQA